MTNIGYDEKGNAKKYVRRGRFPFLHYRKRIVVSLEPQGSQGDFIVLRLERTREPSLIYRVEIADLYALLVRKSVQNRQLEKARSRIGKGPRKVRRR